MILGPSCEWVSNTNMDALEELGTETGGVANPMVEMKIHSRKGHVVSSSGSDDALDVDRAGENAAEEEKKEGNKVDGDQPWQTHKLTLLREVFYLTQV